MALNVDFLLQISHWQGDIHGGAAMALLGRELEKGGPGQSPAPWQAGVGGRRENIVSRTQRSRWSFSLLPTTQAKPTPLPSPMRCEPSLREGSRFLCAACLHQLPPPPSCCEDKAVCAVFFWWLNYVKQPRWLQKGWIKSHSRGERSSPNVK